MANYQYTADLMDDVLFRTGEPVGSAGSRTTSDFGTAALRYINRAYQAIWMGGSELDPSINEEWYWLRADPPGVVTIEPEITTGTVSVTNNNTAITFSSAPAASVANWFFKTDDHADVFRISSHTGGNTAATLDGVFTDATDTAAAYKLFKMEYTLATDILRLLSPMRVYQDSRQEVEGVSLPSLEANWPLSTPWSGVPREFAQLTENKVRFSHYGGTASTEYIRIEYDYLQRPSVLTDSGSEEPAIPWHYRKTIADAAVFFIFLDKNDNRADAAGLAARSGLRAMSRENRHRWATMSRNFGKIMPRLARTEPFAQPLRTQSGLIIG